MELAARVAAVPLPARCPLADPPADLLAGEPGLAGLPLPLHAHLGEAARGEHQRQRDLGGSRRGSFMLITPNFQC